MSKFTEEHVHLLGVLSDYELARQVGVRPATITYHRMRRGIAPANPPPVDWSKDEDARLGTMTDGHLAEALGRTADAVYFRRMRLKIPAYGRDNSASGPLAAVHLRVPEKMKARWVEESRAAGMRLTEWVVQRVERDS